MMRIEKEDKELMEIALALDMTVGEIVDLQDYLKEKQITDVQQFVKNLIKEEMYK